MSEKPTPLREALAEAVSDLCEAIKDLEGHWRMMVPIVPFVERKTAAEDRVAALIAQIPLVFEAREEK